MGKEGGMVPVNLLKERSITPRRGVEVALKGKIDPEKRLFCRKSFLSWVQLERSEGRGPDRWFNLRLRICR